MTTSDRAALETREKSGGSVEIAVTLDFDKLVFNFKDRAPTPAEIDAAIAKSKSTVGVNAVVLEVMVQFHHVYEGLVWRGFKRIGTVSNNAETWHRWQRRFDTILELEHIHFERGQELERRHFERSKE